jgi:hypothetical protein
MAGLSSKDELRFRRKAVMDMIERYRKERNESFLAWKTKVASLTPKIHAANPAHIQEAAFNRKFTGCTCQQSFHECTCNPNTILAQIRNFKEQIQTLMISAGKILEEEHIKPPKEGKPITESLSSFEGIQLGASRRLQELLAKVSSYIWQIEIKLEKIAAINLQYTIAADRAEHAAEALVDDSDASSDESDDSDDSNYSGYSY